MKRLLNDSLFGTQYGKTTLNLNLSKYVCTFKHLLFGHFAKEDNKNCEMLLLVYYILH